MEKERFAKLLGICAFIALVFTVGMLFSSKVHIGFFGYVAYPIVCTFFTTIGTVIGDAFCRFTKPDAFLSTGATDTFKKKIFWMVGPQFVGWFIGFMATSGFMKNVLGFGGL